MIVYVDLTTNQLKVETRTHEVEMLTEHQARVLIMNLIQGLMDLTKARFEK